MSYNEIESKAVDAIKKAIPMSLKKDMIKKSEGLFAELYQVDVISEHYIACAIDGVGTKVIIAQAMEKFESVGIDCVAMVANDLATLGYVSPFLFMDCISCQKTIQEKKITGSIIKGISEGLKKCNADNILKNSIRINFGKGETASVEEIISSPKFGYGFDIVGCMIGFIPKSKITKKPISEGDKIISLPSSGAHSNGFTDLRHFLLNGNFETRKEFKKLYKGRFSLDSKFENSTIGEVLLEPTKIYIEEMIKISKEFNVFGINNTGKGLKNFNRIHGNFEFRINNPLKPNPIFELFQKESKFQDKKMYETFNMGMGFFIICKEKDSDRILNIAKGSNIVGEVRKSDKNKVVLEKNNKKIVFEGY